MHFLFTTLLLLLTTTISTNAKPLPYFRSAAAAHFHEIERRWSEGQSEVCRLGPPLPGCYVLAWVQDLLVRDDVSSWSTAPQPMMDQQSVEVMIEDAEIHAAHSIRDATPAWPVIHASSSSSSEAPVPATRHLFDDPDRFVSTTDERTMSERTRLRRVYSQTRGDLGFIAKVKDVASRFVGGQQQGMLGLEKRSKRDAVDEAPVLQPRKGMAYRYAV